MIGRWICWISLGMLVTILLCVRPVSGDGQSTSGFLSTSSSPTVQPSPWAKKSEPSVWQKMNSGTKKFFSGVGNALTFKKSPPKKSPALPYNTWIKPAKEEPKPNWFASLFEKKKEKPKSPSDWINQKRPNP
jgi:hypothetical protein